MYVCNECPAHTLIVVIVVLFYRWRRWSNSHQHSLRYDGTEGRRRPLAERWKGQTHHIRRGVW